MFRTSFEWREGSALIRIACVRMRGLELLRKADPSAQSGPRDDSYGVVSRGALSKLFQVRHFRIPKDGKAS